jgi:hypothetical protein
MVVASQKWLWAVLVLVLAFSTEARMLSTYQEKVPSNFEHVENVKQNPFKRINFGRIAKVNPVSPFGPSD